MGNAARSYIFQPLMKSGWDVGFHAYDPYRYTIEGTRIFQTTRPYTELGYLLGSKAEQTINVVHTQNRKSNLNFGMDFRFISSPGFLRNQNASHSNMRFHTYYQSPNRKYGLYLIYVGNRLKSSENGGLVDESQLKGLAFNDPFEIQTKIGANNSTTRNPFKTYIISGNEYRETMILLRQQFDFGKKDSLITDDSSALKIFYPRFRLQHNFRFTSNTYTYKDQDVNKSNYLNYYNFTVIDDTINFSDRWRDFTNEFSILTFPQKTNLNQFLKLGAAIQNLFGDYKGGTENLYNVYGIAEYRNRTRNQVWDIEAAGKLFLNGYNSGDYEAKVSLKRLLGRNIGSLELGFQNVNRTPSAIFFKRTNFPVITNSTFGKENYTRLFATYQNPKLQLKLSGEYYLVNRYSYFTDYFVADQFSTLFNVLHVSAEKRFRLLKNVHWYSEVHLQQRAGDGPVNLPLLFTRNRIQFEGNLGFKNLLLTTGVEMRYHTPYKADNYSPLNGQFVFQDTSTITNRPELNIFLNFRIRSFKAFIRLENINAIGQNNNFTARYYPYYPMWTRVGIWWSFVN